MPRPAGAVRICPECGGNLQSTEPERLTSVEVAAHEAHSSTGPGCQCLLCGYEEPLTHPTEWAPSH